MSKRNALTAFLAILLVFSSQTASSAQGGDIHGRWHGVIDYEIQTFINGQFAGGATGRYMGDMSLDFRRFDPNYSNGELSLTIGNIELRDLSEDPFGPTFAAGTVLGTNWGEGPMGPPVGNFAVSYPSILDSGIIDTSSGAASGDIFMNLGSPSGNGTISSYSFQTVPEPASLIMAGMASAIVAAAALAQKSRARSGTA